LIISVAHFNRNYEMIYLGDKLKSHCGVTIHETLSSEILVLHNEILVCRLAFFAAQFLCTLSQQLIILSLKLQLFFLQRFRTLRNRIELLLHVQCNLGCLVRPFFSLLLLSL